MKATFTAFSVCSVILLISVAPVRAEGEWEITSQSEAALQRGLNWLAQNQGPEGNWQSDDLGLVAMGALAFLADGHTPGRGKYGANVDRALNYILTNAKSSGLLNMQQPQRAMYNHGLATFVLGQAYGMTSDARIGSVLERALKLIAATQCHDGGWDYQAAAQENGHDLSLAVMQAKALRSAVDSGLEVSPDVIKRAVANVRLHYSFRGGARGTEAEQRREPGQFTYTIGGGGPSLAMAQCCWVVCLQEFGQYDDWRIPKNMDIITAEVKKLPTVSNHSGQPAIDAYTLYYVGQAMYQVGGAQWRDNYPRLRDHLVATQLQLPADIHQDGLWRDTRWMGGSPQGNLYATAVACFVLAIPNRYLPILQEGKIKQYQTGK